MRDYRIEYTSAKNYTRMMEGYQGLYGTKAIVIEAKDKKEAKANACYVIPKNAVIVKITVA